MGERGPKPAPLEQKIAKGTNRQDRDGVQLTAGEPMRLPAPADLGPEGSALWTHVMNTAGWVIYSDLPTLRLLADAYDRREIYRHELTTRGAVLEEFRGQGDSQYTITLINPAARALEATEAQITKWLALLGLTPSDRGRLGLTAATTETTLERLRKSRLGSEGPAVSSTPATKAPSHKRKSKRATAKES